MKKNHWKIRVMMWWAERIVKVPYFVNFTPPSEENMVGMGFGWNPEITQKMVANYQVQPQRPSRAQRRAMKRASENIAEEILKNE